MLSAPSDLLVEGQGVLLLRPSALMADPVLAQCRLPRDPSRLMGLYPLVCRVRPE